MVIKSIVTGVIPHIQNQLLFNLNEPPESKLSVRFQKPGPILVERLGAGTHGKHPNFIENAPPPLQFSAISEENLALAVTLAKRDIKKKKLDIELEKLRKTKELADKKSKTKLVPSKGYRTKLRQREERRRAGKSVRSVEVQADVKQKKSLNHASSHRTTGIAAHQQTNVKDYPATTNSPPTRDIGSYDVIPEDEKHMKEICNLRQDMNSHVQTIYKFNQVKLSKQGPGHLQNLNESEKKEEEKKIMHAEEKASRTARLMYGLHHQVHEIQAELTKLGPDLLKGSKKTLNLGKLAAAHRATVRAIQSYVQNLSGYDITYGLPRVNKDINYLTDKLTQCCMDLEVGGVTGVPCVVNVMCQEKNDYNNWSRKDGKPQTTFAETREAWKPIKETLINGRRNSSSPVNRAGREPQVDRLCREYPAGIHDQTPERLEAIRSGIVALLRARDQSPSPLPKSKPKALRQQARSPPRKGLLIPQNIKKEKKIKGRPEGKNDEILHVDTHYLEPTVASQMKVKDASNVHHSPVHKAERRSESSPKSQIPNYGQKTIRGISPRRDDDGFLTHLDVGVPREWVAEAERAIKSKLKPFLDKAQMISDKETSEYPNHSLRQKLSETVSEKVGFNAEILSDMILHDLMRDAATELQRLEDDKRAETNSKKMKDAPQIETMLQRLNQMEREQDEIRLKWNSVAYKDEEYPRKASKKVLYKDEKPSTPKPIRITSSLEPGKFTSYENDGIEYSQPDGNMSDCQAPSSLVDSLLLRGSEPKHPLVRPLLPVSINNETLNSIFNYKKDYESYLERTSNVSVGNFNPWLLVERVSDDILEDCFSQITQEIFDTGSASAIEKVFRSEFIPTVGENFVAKVETDSNIEEGYSDDYEDAEDFEDDTYEDD